MMSRFKSTLFFLPLLGALSACAGSPITHPNRLRAEEHLGNAHALLQRNHPHQALLSVKKALKRHRLSGDFPGTIDDMNRLARLSLILGNKDRAKVWIDRALLLETVGGPPDRKAETLLLGARIAGAVRYPVWIREARKAIEALPDSGDGKKRRLFSSLYGIEGNRQSEEKNYRQARILFMKALTIDKARGDRLAVASDLAGMGRADLLAGKTAQAMDSFGKAREIDASLGNHAGLAFDLEGQALVHSSQGQFKVAARQMLKASGIEEALGNREQARKDLAFIASFASKVGGIPPEEIRVILGSWFDTGLGQE